MNANRSSDLSSTILTDSAQATTLKTATAAHAYSTSVHFEPLDPTWIKPPSPKIDDIPWSQANGLPSDDEL